jgi:hypothetical protein
MNEGEIEVGIKGEELGFFSCHPRYPSLLEVIF